MSADLSKDMKTLADQPRERVYRHRLNGLPTMDVSTKSPVSFHPHDVAEMFWSMDAQQQAMFFNQLACVSQDTKLTMQLQYITDRAELTREARNVMQLIGDYSERSV